MRRLDRLLGPMPPLPEQGQHEATGLDGLTRRGPYERLLLAEWALADELPDEFLRRAASREHLFHEVSRVVPVGGRVCTVLFDAGPGQLGGPRLAHLALLVAFARRAEAAKAGFVWGTLQGGHPDPGALRALLAARSARAATAEDVARWDERLGPRVGADERFVVSGPELAVPAGRDRVVVSEPWDEDALEIEVRRGGRAGSRVRLPLPEPAVRTRWVRDPFRPTRPPVTYARPSEQGPRVGKLTPFLRFSPDGNRLLAVTEGGALVGWRLPEGKRKDIAPVARVWSPNLPGSRVLGVGWNAGGVFGLYRLPEDVPDRGRVRIEGLAQPVFWDDFQAHGEGHAPGVLLAWRFSGGNGRVLFLDPDGNLHVRSFRGEPIPGRVDVAALSRRNGNVLLVVRGPGATLRAIGDTTLGVGHVLRLPGLERAFPAERALAGPVVLFESASEWSNTMDPAPVPRQGEAVASCATAERRGVAWRDRHGHLSFAWRWPQAGPEVVLARSVRAATGLEAFPGTLVAWLGDDGVVTVHDVATGHDVIRWTSG